MADVTSALGALTLGGSVAIVLLGATTRLGRGKYASRWRCWAWLILCLRLAIPLPSLSQPLGAKPPIQLSAPSNAIIYRYQPGATPNTHPNTTVPPAQPGETQQPSTSNPETASGASGSSTSNPNTSARSLTLSLSQLLLLLWLLGAVVMAIWAATAHLRFLSYVRRWASPLQRPEVINLYRQLGNQLNLCHLPVLLVCPGLSVPMLAGLIRPVLLLPDLELSVDELHYALLHELTHYHRRDIWLKALALWVNILHWFNPLVWYMVRLVDRDTELACDEGALAHLPRSEHAAYGRAILTTVERLACTPAFTHKERLS